MFAGIGLLTVVGVGKYIVLRRLMPGCCGINKVWGQGMVNPILADIGLVSKDLACVLAEQMKGLSLYKGLLQKSAFFRHSSFIKLRKGFKAPNKSTPPIQISPDPEVIKLFSYST